METLSGRSGQCAPSTSGRFGSSGLRSIGSPVNRVELHERSRSRCAGPAWRRLASAAADDASAPQPEPQQAVPPSNRMMAAMALSPIAAMSMPLLQNEAWAQSMRDFAQALQQRVNLGVRSDAFADWSKGLDRNVTFMDWTFKLTGVDLTYVWDPELWTKFRDAIWHDHPQLFWNELMDRIEYSKSAPCMPMHVGHAQPPSASGRVGPTTCVAPVHGPSTCIVPMHGPPDPAPPLPRPTEGLIPQAGIVGDMRISYAKFLQLLEANRVKRVVVYGDMKTAVVEVRRPAGQKKVKAELY